MRKQLLQTMDRYKLDLVSAGRDQKKILMAVTSGFFFHAARKDPQEVRTGQLAWWVCSSNFGDLH